MPKAHSAASIAPVCLLYGKKGKEDAFDEYLASEALSRIKSALAGDASIAISEFEAEEADIADVMDEVSTPAMWGASRLVILRGAEAIVAPAAADRERLAPLAARMAAFASTRGAQGRLVLVARGLDVKDGTPRSTWEPAVGLFAAVDKAGGLRPCIPPYERDLKVALVQTARDKGVQLLPAAADTIMAMTGNDQLAAQEELEKLITSAGERKRITPEDVQAVASALPDMNVFALAEKMLDGETAGALAVLRSLEQMPATRSSAFILASLAASWRRYLATALDVEKGSTPRAAAAAAGVRQFFQRDFVRRLDKWPAARLVALLARALQCDIEVKTGTVAEEIALETFVIEACEGRLEKRELAGRWVFEI